LTISETKVVLEGITIGGKSMVEHLETINHSEAILFVEDLIADKKRVGRVESKKPSCNDFERN
jgi:hypothetical protein